MVSFVSEWKECQLGDLITFQRGHDLPKTKMRSGEYPVVGSNGIIGYHNEYTTDAPSITIGRSGNVGKPFLYNGKSWSHNTTLYIKEYKNVEPIFIYYYLQTLDLGNYAGGSAVPTLNRNHIHTLNVSVPVEIEEQRQIASILSSLDDKIKLNSTINENLEQQAQAIFKSWFMDLEPFGGVMPDDWRIGTVLDLSKEIICGKTPSTRKKEYYGDYMPFITIPDMHNRVYTTTTERYLSELGANSQMKKTLPKNSICVSCIGTAGLVALVSTDSQTNQQINSIVPKEGYSSYYIFLLMQTFSEKINRLGQSGSTIVNLNKAQFGMMEALVPTVSSMNDFDSVAKPLFEKILANQQENQRLATLRDTLLPKLMNGEIDVSEVEI